MRLILMRGNNILLVLLCLIPGLVLTACETGRQPEIVVGVDGCDSCGMVIDEAGQACVYTIDRENHTFCSPGCLLKEYEKRRREGQPPPDEVRAADYRTGELHLADDVTFMLTEHIPTVMNWGVVGFGSEEQAIGHRQHPDEILVDWTGLRRLRGVIDRTVELTVTAEGIVPEVVELTKDELVEWIFRAQDLEADLELVVRGYEELGSIAVGAAGEPVSVRMLAAKPGAGFPIIRLHDGAVLGQVRVAGSHTADEEER